MSWWYPWPVPLVLASRSPRRHEILLRAGIPHSVVPSHIDEGKGASGGDPAAEVAAWARRKAEAVAPVCAGRPVLGADTLVSLDGRMLGKPESREEAREMLSSLSGRTHTVFGGVCVIWPERGVDLELVEETDVLFRDLEPAEIEAYIDTGEPMDKAGAYGIQDYGSLLVRRVEGCYFNVMGLPLSRTIEAIRSEDAGHSSP